MKRLLFFAIVFVGCVQHKPVEDPSAWKKITMDFRRFDQDGLAGPPGGKVSANYEFCIPATEKYWKRVKKIDPTAGRAKSRGRVNCDNEHWMIVGSTHQKNFQRVLFELASLPFVTEIQETFYE